MKVAILSDEISTDFETAVELGISWGLRAFELRRLGSGRVPRVASSEIEQVDRLRRGHGLCITGLSTGLFKIPADHPEVEQRLAEDLPRACEIAHPLGTDVINDFGFRKPPEQGGERGEVAAKECPPRVIDLLGRAVDTVARCGCRFFLENEHVCWPDTGAATARIVRALGRPNLFVNWDPTNAAHPGEVPFPDGYHAVRGLIAHVHVKDFDPLQGGRIVPPGQGAVNWPAQLRALLADNYRGWLVIETHMRPRVESSRRCVQALREMLAVLGAT